MAQAQEMGLSVYLQLNEGGSAVLSVLGTNMDGSWTAKDATTVELTFDGSSAEATLEGEELVMQQDGDVMRFKRGEIPPVASEVQRDENQGGRAGSLGDLLKRLSITFCAARRLVTAGLFVQATKEQAFCETILIRVRFTIK